MSPYMLNSNRRKVITAKIKEVLKKEGSITLYEACQLGYHPYILELIGEMLKKSKKFRLIMNGEEIGQATKNGS